MDDGIGTIIYIILGLVFFAAQALRKKKPAPAAPRDEVYESETEVDRPPRSLLEEFLGETQRYESVEKAVENPPEDDDDFLPKSSRIVDKKVELNREKETARKEVLSKSGIAEHSEAQKGMPKRGSDFDLRKAVIYSAILERKYF